MKHILPTAIHITALTGLLTVTASASETSKPVATIAALDPAAKQAPMPEPPPASVVPPLHGTDLSEMRLSGGAYSQTTKDGRLITFTVDAALQQHTDALFEKYRVPAGAAVVLNSRTGRVLALSQKRRQQSSADTSRVAFDPSPPAASLFKVVTAAALMEERNIPLSETTCYAGGSSKLHMRHIDGPIPEDHACVSLETALGRSVNAVIAKLSDRHLDRGSLREYAKRFFFNRPLDFDVPIDRSTADIPTDRLERARAAAGFWHTHISPIHAAMMVQSIAQDGAMLRPYIVDRVTASNGEVIYKAAPKYLSHTVSKATAEKLRAALVHTTENGTARKSFRDSRGRPYLPGVKVAGKTGTLTGERPYRAYTWFAGLAPSDTPEVAIAVLVVNEPKWRIKASQMAALILKAYFDQKRR